ncbi:arginine--tRNA ligase, partial [Candidatus Microgenomates bacterium]
MKHDLELRLSQLITDYAGKKVSVNLTVPPNSQFGHYSTNIALILAKTLGKSGQKIAQELKDSITASKEKELEYIAEVSIAGLGFINFRLTQEALIKNTQTILAEAQNYGKPLKAPKKTIIVEFGHPNSHKMMHIGHLRNLTTGEAIIRLLEFVGYNAVRANYQGDVGMHIAKCLYGLQLPEFAEAYQQALSETIHEQVALLGKAYAAGSKAFEENDQIKQAIGEINKQIYKKDKKIWNIYQTTRKWSLDYFELIYKRLYVHYDRYYFESEVYQSGKKYVEEALNVGVFEKSDGAIIFPGKKYGLHNRVFVTSEGNATYEAKDLGLGALQLKEYNPDQIIHIVGPEQAGYFQVIFEALDRVWPGTKDKEMHLIYGFVQLKSGKMSSRTGNVVTAWWLLEAAKQEIINILESNTSNYTKEQQSDIAEKAGVAAIKYG